MTYVFGLMAIVAFAGFGLNALSRNGHGMVYSAVVFAVWLAALLWSIGAIG